MGLFSFLDKLIDKLPIQGRVERWKNELENITREREQLLKGSCDAKKAKRVVDIDARIAYLNQLLKNKAAE